MGCLTHSNRSEETSGLPTVARICGLLGRVAPAKAAGEQDEQKQFIDAGATVVESSCQYEKQEQLLYTTSLCTEQRHLLHLPDRSLGLGLRFST